MVTSRSIAIIPARGGSKRISRKNIVDFCGKPMLAWTIDAALQSGRFARVMVSTDDEEIAETAVRFGASVPFLRSRFVDDEAPVSLATIATLMQLREDLEEQYDTVVQLMANCPLRTAEQVRSALAYFEETDSDSLISCFRFGWMNPWWAATVDTDGKPTVLFPEAYRARSQDLPPLYCPSGAIWIAKVERLIEHQSFHLEGRRYWPMPWQAAIDIDDHEDMNMARALFDAGVGDS